MKISDLEHTSLLKTAINVVCERLKITPEQFHERMIERAKELGQIDRVEILSVTYDEKNNSVNTTIRRSNPARGIKVTTGFNLPSSEITSDGNKNF